MHEKQYGSPSSKSGMKLAEIKLFSHLITSLIESIMRMKHTSNYQLMNIKRATSNYILKFERGSIIMIS